jgi:hypothetical protein
MRKFILASIMVMFAVSVCFAQAAKSPETKALSGKVESVILGDAAKGVVSKITAIEENGAKVTFLVKAATKISDSAMKMLTLDKIKKDDKISVKYVISKEGMSEATSISLVK